MLYFPFKNFEEFKELFGITQHGNGVKSRKNRILLSYLKQPGLLKKARESGDYSLVNIRSMAELRQVMLEHIQQSGKDDESLPYEMHLKNYTFWSDKYSTDSKNGITLDGDTKAIRYINMATNHDYKMKAGKMFNHLISTSKFGQELPTQVITYLCEELTMEWCSHNALFNGVELHIDEDFEAIYDSEKCKGDFHSCMVDRGHEDFYAIHVKNCKAAYLVDEDGMIIARAIIFTAKDENGNGYQACERQYSSGCDDILKRMLVDRLIMDGAINIYKKIGAGCSEATAWVGVNGEDMSHLKLYIELEDFRTYSTVSYADSFKWVSLHKQRAYNYSDSDWDEMIDITDETIDDYHGESDEDGEGGGPEEYDDYHQYYAYETQLCYLHGAEIYVDVDNLDDFVFIEALDEYHHQDDVVACDQCGKWHKKENAIHRSDVDAYFCNETCEAKYIKENFAYSQYDDDYFYNEDDLTVINVWSDKDQTYQQISISCLSRDYLIREGKAFGAGDIWFTTQAA